MKVRFRTVFWIGAAVLVAVLLALAFRPQAVPVDVAESVVAPMLVTVRDEGRTRVRDEYVVSAPVAGRLRRLAVEPGDAVEAGQPVARIEATPPPFLDVRQQADLEAAVRSASAAASAAQAEIERAEAQARFARNEARRAAELRASDLVSDQQVERAQLELRVAESAVAAARDALRVRQAELAAARARLAQPGAAPVGGDVVEVRAPVAARVLRVARESESVIAAGAEVMTLGDPHQLEVVVELLSTEAVQVRPGAEVIIDDWGGEAPALAGRVRLVEPAGFREVSALGVEEQRVNVIVDLVDPQAAWSALGHGYRVEAAIVIWQADDVLQVPVAALFRSGGAWAVFRVEADRARLTPVETGRSNGRDVQILSGLDAGDTVVLYPGEQLSDGLRVRPRGGGG
jgi:HlyD family secretion protein